MLCRRYGSHFVASPARETRHCARQADVVAAQRCRFWQSVWGPPSMPGHACASTRASSSRRLQDFARVPRGRVWLVCTAHRDSNARRQRHLERAAWVRFCSFPDTNALDDPWGRRGKCFPSQRAKQGMVSGCWTHDAKAQGNAVSIPAGTGLCRHIPWRTGQHCRAGRHPRSLWRGSTCSIRRHDAKPHTTEDLDLPSIPASAFSRRSSARTATSSGSVEAGASRLGRIAQEISGWKAVPRMWRDEAQRCVHQSTMETGNVSGLQRMHRAEAWGRHAVSMHPMRPMARYMSLCKQASKSAVEHVPSMLNLWCSQAMFYLQNKTNAGIFRHRSMES